MADAAAAIRHQKRMEEKVYKELGNPTGEDRPALLKWWRRIQDLPADDRLNYALGSATGQLEKDITGDGVNGPNTLGDRIRERYLGTDFRHQQLRALMSIRQGKDQSLEAY